MTKNKTFFSHQFVCLNGLQLTVGHETSLARGFGIFYYLITIIFLKMLPSFSFFL